MAKTTVPVTKASLIGGVVGPRGAIDCLTLTDQARVRRIEMAPAAFTQNTTSPLYKGAVGIRGIVLAAYAAAHVAPVGGTLALNLRCWDVSAGAAVTIATIDPETLVVDTGAPLTLQTANDALVLEATDTFFVESVADNNAVGTASVGLVVTVLFLPLELAADAAFITGTKDGL